MTNFAGIAALIAALLAGSAGVSVAADKPPIVVEIESPLASTQPLQGYLRPTADAGPSPAVILLHGCNGDWHRTDERWAKRIAGWGYVTLTVDSLGPRGVDSCRNTTPHDVDRDAYRALKFLVGLPSVDPTRVAVLGFARGGATALRAVEHGPFEKTSPNKFGAAIAFYPPCSNFNGYMTVPTLILVGELDDEAPAKECRNMVDGQDSWGVSRQERGAPVKLIVYPDTYHAFDAPGSNSARGDAPIAFDQSVTDRASEALRAFLGATIGAKE